MRIKNYYKIICNIAIKFHLKIRGWIDLIRYCNFVSFVTIFPKLNLSFNITFKYKYHFLSET